MGYLEGFRGYNWDYFKEAQTPFVEIYSRHGLAEDDLGDYPNLHDMGPRNYEGTMLYGLNQGYKFGVIGSTDQHAGYPGSYGDGLMAVIAPSNTREAIWDAMQKRHVYCVTGDKIKLDFRINEAIMGDEIKANKRTIKVKVDPNTLTPATQAVILDVTMPRKAKLTADFNGKTFSYSMDELLHGTYSKFMIGWLSEAIQFHRAAPESVYKVEYTVEDDAPEKDTDYYYVRVRQRDNNWAFSSAIWVDRE